MLSPISKDTVMVAALDPGIQLHVRNKRSTAEEHFPPERILLFVHGATFPSETGFDIDLPGGSWMDFVARRGFDVYCMDVRGYGRSTRTAAMDQPPTENPPFADTREAVRDIAAVVEFILERRRVPRLNLLGWSWGTAIIAGYAAANPDKVEKLVLYAPVWFPHRRPPYQGAYRTGTHESVRPYRFAGIPKERLEEISPADWYDQWWSANLATDPIGAARNPPAVRSPNGALKDFCEFWAVDKPTYDAAAIRVSTMLVVGEWDATTPPTMARALFEQLTGTAHRRLLVLPEGSHFISLEKNRMRLMREVQHFLEAPTLATG